MKLSIVTTLYYSAPYIEEFYSRISACASEITEDYELIFVNDGSPDNALEICLALRQQDKRVCVVDLSRNFGHHKAIMAGLSSSKGDYVFLIDIDLEEAPELLNTFYLEITKSNLDLVYGIQGNRKGGIFERMTGGLFYWIFNKLSGLQIPPNQLIARIMTRRFVNALIKFRESELFLAGLQELTGFSRVGILCKKQSKGSTTYTLSKKIFQAVNAITSFSNIPLILLFYLGLIIMCASMILGAYIIIRYFYGGTGVQGWLSLMLIISFFSGIIILSIGVLGIYISKIFMEVKARPNVIVREIFR